MLITKLQYGVIKVSSLIGKGTPSISILVTFSSNTQEPLYPRLSGASLPYRPSSLVQKKTLPSQIEIFPPHSIPEIIPLKGVLWATFSISKVFLTDFFHEF